MSIVMIQPDGTQCHHNAIFCTINTIRLYGVHIGSFLKPNLRLSPTPTRHRLKDLSDDDTPEFCGDAAEQVSCYVLQVCGSINIPEFTPQNSLISAYISEQVP